MFWGRCQSDTAFPSSRPSVSSFRDKPLQQVRHRCFQRLHICEHDFLPVYITQRHLLLSNHTLVATELFSKGAKGSVRASSRGLGYIVHIECLVVGTPARGQHAMGTGLCPYSMIPIRVRETSFQHSFTGDNAGLTRIQTIHSRNHASLLILPSRPEENSCTTRACKPLKIRPSRGPFPSSNMSRAP